MLNLALKHRLLTIAAVAKSPLSLLGCRWWCPICGFRGPFITGKPAKTPRRRYARCLKCGSLERHRLQWLVLQEILHQRAPEEMAVLHLAPEPFLEKRFRTMFGVYETADLERVDVDHPGADIRNLLFATSTYDLIFASHVLEHVDNDRAALSEIARVLKPGGIALLPVPILAMQTIEYERPNPHEHNHVRAPGRDYYDRYREFFARVDIRSSEEYAEEHQVWTYEDRTHPIPPRPPVPGERHVDFVPVCYRH